jgi:hypothetical protein
MIAVLDLGAELDKLSMLNGVMTATPQPTDHIRADVDDPRTAGEVV